MSPTVDLAGGGAYHVKMKDRLDMEAMIIWHIVRDDQ